MYVSEVERPGSFQNLYWRFIRRPIFHARTYIGMKIAGLTWDDIKMDNHCELLCLLYNDTELLMIDKAIDEENYDETLH